MGKRALLSIFPKISHGQELHLEKGDYLYYDKHTQK
jgi:hypothetical protein